MSKRKWKHRAQNGPKAPKPPLPPDPLPPEKNKNRFRLTMTVMRGLGAGFRTRYPALRVEAHPASNDREGAQLIFRDHTTDSGFYLRVIEDAHGCFQMAIREVRICGNPIYRLYLYNQNAKYVLSEPDSLEQIEAWIEKHVQQWLTLIQTKHDKSPAPGYTRRRV